MDKIILEPIGIIHSPFTSPKGTPIQPTAGKNLKGYAVVYEKYIKGLSDLEKFSHIYLIYYFHLSEKSDLLVKPYMDNKLHGVFSTRAPSRPNPIGLSIVKLSKIEKNIVYFEDVDILDGTPLLDIKPYVPEFDIRDVQTKGWLENNVHKLPNTKDDGRFLKNTKK